jgi:hypothetical protein
VRGEGTLGRGSRRACGARPASGGGGEWAEGVALGPNAGSHLFYVFYFLFSNLVQIIISTMF